VGQRLRHDTVAGRAGVEGVLRVMEALDMLAPARSDEAARADARARPAESYDTSWGRAPQSGYLVLGTDLVQRVAKGQRLGVLHLRIHEQFFTQTQVEIQAPEAGLVIGLTRNPLVTVGDAVIPVGIVGRPRT